MILTKIFLTLMNNTAFWKTYENVREHRDMKLVTTDKRRNQLLSEPNYRTQKYFSENFLAIEMEKTKVKWISQYILPWQYWEISKTLMDEFWYNYIRPKYQNNAKLCYMDTERFIIHIKTESLYVGIGNGVENWFGTSNYSEDDKRPLPIGKNKKIISFFQDELGRKIMIEFVTLRPKTYSYLM